MKKLFLFSFLIVFSKFVFSQDTIVKKNGDKIRAKIMEISPTEVKYKKFDFLDGPIYIEKKSEIEVVIFSNGMKEHFDNVKQNPTSNNYNPPANTDYYGGYVPKNNKIEMWGDHFKYNFSDITEREAHEILLQSKDKRIMGLVQEAKQNHGLQFIGFGAFPLGLAALYCLEISLIQGYNPNTGTNTSNSNKRTYQTFAGIFAITGIACPIASGIFKHNRSIKNKEAVKLYNEKY